MSLYSRLFKENPSADVLLGLIGMHREAFGRYRDIYPSADGTEIIVYTRCGGMNRHEWRELYKTLEKHPYYVRDYDDDWDSTYSYIVFKTPQIGVITCKALAGGHEPETIKAKFDKEMAEMTIPGTEAYKRAQDLAKEIQSAIDENPDGGFIDL